MIENKAKMDETNPEEKEIKNGRGPTRFPSKLRRILEDAEEEGFGDIIAWLPDGISFNIFKPEEFAKTIMPRYFSHTNYRSFQRSMYHYKFSKMRNTKASNAYSHPQFTKEDKSQCPKFLKKKKFQSKKSNPLKLSQMHVPQMYQVMPAAHQHIVAPMDQFRMVNIKTTPPYSNFFPVSNPSTSSLNTVESHCRDIIDNFPPLSTNSCQSEFNSTQIPLTAQAGSMNDQFSFEHEPLLTLPICSIEEPKSEVQMRPIELTFDDKSVMGMKPTPISASSSEEGEMLTMVLSNRIDRDLTAIVCHSKEDASFTDPFAFPLDDDLEPTPIVVN